MAEEIPVAPLKIADRVNGQKYLFNGEIRIWREYSSAGKFHCEHNRQKNACRDCNDPVICEHQKTQYLCSDCFYKCEVCGKSLCGLHHNNSYGESDYLEALDIVYREEGLEAFSFRRLNELRLYFPLYRFGWNSEKICQRYGMTTKEWKQRRKEWLNRSRGTITWNEEKVWESWDQLVNQFGYVPTYNEVRHEARGLRGVYNYMKVYGIDMDAVRAKYPDQNYGPQFNQMSGTDPTGGMKNRARWTESVNGMRWHSRVEASVSNFLYARGISHQKGKLYDEKYSDESDYARGWYDIHFESLDGDTIDLEIWGNIDDKYMEKRTAKEKFNEDNPNFLGIEWYDCIESGLTKALEPYIGVIQPFIFEKPEHKIIQTAFWSDADEIIETCRWLAKQQPDGRFPPESWLRKRYKHKDRDGETYGTLSVYIQKYVGGMQVLRTILGEGYHRHLKWTQESVLIALDEWMEEYGVTPQAYYLRQKSQNNPWDEVCSYARSIYRGTGKHVGTFAEAMEILGWSQKHRRSKWEKEA